MSNVLAKYAHKKFLRDVLPKPMLHHLRIHASPRTYFKLIQMSKYFLVYERPQIERFKNICYWHNPAIVYIFENGDKIFEVVGKRLWISTYCFAWNNSKNTVAQYLERVYRCDITDLRLQDQTLTYADLKILMESGTIKNLAFYYNTFTHSNGDSVEIEDILKMTPLIIYVFYVSHDTNFTFNFQKTAALPAFKNLISFHIEGIGESFDCFAFCDLLKKTMFSQARLGFKKNELLSYQNDLQMALKCIPGIILKKSYKGLLIKRKNIEKVRDKV